MDLRDAAVIGPEEQPIDPRNLLSRKLQKIIAYVNYVVKKIVYPIFGIWSPHFRKKMIHSLRAAF